MKFTFKILLSFVLIIFVFGLFFYSSTESVIAIPGAPCTTGRDCNTGAGEACEENDEGEYRCAVVEDVSDEDEDEDIRSGVGGACIVNSDCGSGLVCRSGTCDRPTGDDPCDGQGCGGSICSDDSGCSGSLECVSGVCTDVNDDNNDNGSSSGNYGLDSVPSDVPRGEIGDTIVRVVQYVLGLVGVILFVMIIYGGILYMTAAGNEEQAKKAKSVLTYAIIGIVIIAFAFIIAEFVINALTG